MEEEEEEGEVGREKRERGERLFRLLGLELQRSRFETSHRVKGPMCNSFAHLFPLMPAHFKKTGFWMPTLLSLPRAQWEKQEQHAHAVTEESVQEQICLPNRAPQSLSLGATADPSHNTNTEESTGLALLSAAGATA